MSKLTNYGENKLADMVRGQAPMLPVNWYFALASAADDASFTELSGTGYARAAVPRTLDDWCGTQGAGTTLPSTGTSHQTSTNIPIDFGTVGAGGWGNADFLVLCDNSSGGNAWAFAPLESTITCSAGMDLSFPAGTIVFTLGLSGGMSDYLSNKLIDFIWRDQLYSWPASMYAAYCISAPTNSIAGAEPSVGGYARVAIASSLAAWSGTQGPGTTVASTGTGGRIANNSACTFPIPTADQGDVGYMQLLDAATSGNLMFWRALTAAKTVRAGAAAPFFAADKLGITFQ